MEELLREHSDFFNYLFSSHHSFAPVDLIIWKDKVKWGGYSYSFFDSQIIFLYQPEAGISFNENIQWNEKLLRLVNFNHLSNDISVEDNISYPLYKEKELTYNEIMVNSALFSASKSADEVEFISNNLQETDLIGTYKKDFSQIKTAVIDLELIIDEFLNGHRQVKALLFNVSFYYSTLRMIRSEIPDFSISNFYNDILIESEKV